MKRCVALLRGINVGRANRIAMADLRDLLASLGYRNVRTVLASGNAVFDGSGTPAAQVERIRAALARHLGVDVPVLVKPAGKFADAIAQNELAGAATHASRLLIAFTRDTGTLAQLAALRALLGENERLQIGAHAAYLWCPDGIAKSRAGAALLGTAAATTRNWATVLKIAHLLRPDAV
jgi:uncharacterized protein (DUF1697 family)